MDYKAIEKEQNRLASTYNITNIHAGCYMCNFENEYGDYDETYASGFRWASYQKNFYE